VVEQVQGPEFKAKNIKICLRLKITRKGSGDTEDSLCSSKSDPVCLDFTTHFRTVLLPQKPAFSSSTALPSQSTSVPSRPEVLFQFVLISNTIHMNQHNA
jgi:hypothetical protein